MLLTIQLLLIAILVAIVIILYITERQRRQKDKHLVKLEEFWDGKERRSVARFNACLDIEYNTNSKAYPSKSRDISSNGIGLVLTEKLVKGTPIRMQIKLPIITPPIEVKGEIVWISELKEPAVNGKRSFSTGIKFTHVAPRFQKILFEYIKNLEKDPKTGEG